MHVTLWRRKASVAFRVMGALGRVWGLVYTACKVGSYMQEGLGCLPIFGLFQGTWPLLATNWIKKYSWELSYNNHNLIRIVVCLLWGHHVLQCKNVERKLACWVACCAACCWACEYQQIHVNINWISLKNVLKIDIIIIIIINIIVDTYWNGGFTLSIA